MSLAFDGPFAADLTGNDNIVLKAVQAFAANTGQTVQVRIALTKNLPVASGIGGGSADAAATLRALDALYPDAASAAALKDIALGIGSDVPACLVSKPLVMWGRGERLSDLVSFPQTPLLLVNPRVGISTAAFENWLAPGAGQIPARSPIIVRSCHTARPAKRSRNTCARTRTGGGDVLNELARMPGIPHGAHERQRCDAGISIPAVRAEMAAIAPAQQSRLVGEEITLLKQ
jgi:4-diphosphocytidyl-2-C-methyl-D-erythritol kinase